MNHCPETCMRFNNTILISHKSNTRWDNNNTINSIILYCCIRLYRFSPYNLIKGIFLFESPCVATLSTDKILLLLSIGFWRMVAIATFFLFFVYRLNLLPKYVSNDVHSPSNTNLNIFTHFWQIKFRAIAYRFYYMVRNFLLIFFPSVCESLFYSLSTLIFVIFDF